MATLDMPFMRLYRNKNKDSTSLRTDDIIGAKPRKAVRDRDPEAFDKMTQLKKLQQNAEMNGSDPMRRTNKNIDHYHRMMSNLPGGLPKWEGMYTAQKGGSAGVRDALTQYEKSEQLSPSPPNQAQYVKAPFFREEKQAPQNIEYPKQRDQPSIRTEGSLDAKKMAAQNSLNGVLGGGKKHFGQPPGQNFGIDPEQLPELPRPTRFRSPQPYNTKEKHNMSLLLAHQ